jgi:RNase P subunit RPR2
MRLGDAIDDHCSRCKRVTDHAIAAMTGDDVVKVVCRTCNSEYKYPHNETGKKENDGRTGVSKGAG